MSSQLYGIIFNKILARYLKVTLEWPHQWGLLAFLHPHALLTCWKIGFCPLCLELRYPAAEMNSESYQRDFLVIYLHFIWVAKHRGDYSGLSPAVDRKSVAKTKVQEHKYLCVTAPGSIFSCMMGTFVASCRLLENRAAREGKRKAVWYVYLKKQSCEKRGKDTRRFQLNFH